jgi:hypothetical protein
VEVGRLRYRLISTLTLTGLLASAAARGEARDPAAAEVLFRDGRSLIVAGDYSAACPKFAESLRLDRAPGTLLNLADCEEHLGHLATAWVYFHDLSREVASSDERQAIAAQRSANLERRLPYLTVRWWDGLTPGMRVTRDGVVLGRASFDIAFPVDPGKHIIVVSDGDKELYRTEVEVEEGQTRVVAPDSSEIQRRTTSVKVTRIAGWTMGAVGATSLGIGAGFGIAALLNKGSVNCPGGVCPNKTAENTYDTAETQARIADVAFGIGIVAVAVAGYLLIFPPHRSPETPSAPMTALASVALGQGVSF